MATKSTVTKPPGGTTLFLRADDTWAAPPGGAGSFAITETEIDFGSTPVKDKRFTITDAGISATSKIMVTPSGNVATGRVGNDWEWDTIGFSALAGTGNFVLTAFPSGFVVGKRKVFYTYA